MSGRAVRSDGSEHAGRPRPPGTRAAEHKGQGTADLALDLGTSVTRVARADGAIVVEEPTIAAVDSDTGRLVAFGHDAAGLGTPTAGRVLLVNPVRNGKLVDVELADAAIAEVLRRAGATWLDHPRVVVCSHVGATGVQRRAVERALRRGGARSVRFVEQPIACAIGAGLPIADPVGQMVVDVGGGTTDVGVVALGSLVTAASVPIGGIELDEAVRVHLARAHGLVAELAVVRELRRALGTVGPVAHDREVEVIGRDALSGRPAAARVTASDLAGALGPVVQPILATALRCITGAPPDLANDLLGTGLLLVGGGARLPGLAQRLASATGVPVHVPEHMEWLGVCGAARSEDVRDRPPALSGLVPD